MAFSELKKAVLKSALSQWGQIFIHEEDRYIDDLSLVVSNHAFQELKNAVYLGLKKALSLRWGNGTFFGVDFVAKQTQF